MSMILQPRVSEKAYELSNSKNVYVFDVPTNANKHEIAKSVADRFDVTVVAVNVSVAKGKNKRMIQKRGRATYGKRSNVKRAYVTVKQGDNIPVFAAIDEATEKAEKRKEKK